MSVKPVALTPVSPKLMASLRVPKCEPQPKPKDDLYYFDEVDNSRVCWRTGFYNARARLTGLQKAVRVREQAAAKAVAVTN